MAALPALRSDSVHPRGPVPGEGFLVTVEGAGSAVAAPGERVLAAMERAQGLGRLTGVSVGCRRGGCGICRVRVLSGRYRSGPMSRAHVGLADEAEGLVLACAIYAESDLSLRLDPTPAWRAKRAAMRPPTGASGARTKNTEE